MAEDTPNNILGTTVSIQTDQAAMDLLAARQQENRVQAETGGTPPGGYGLSGDHPTPPVFPAFTPPDRAAFEQQFVQQQVAAQNYGFFDKTPAQLDRIVSEAYQSEVATAQAAFESASPTAFNLPPEPPLARAPVGFQRGFGPAAYGQPDSPFANPSAYGGPDEPGGLGGPMQWEEGPTPWKEGPTDLVPVSGMTRYGARSQFRADESGNYQNWRFGQDGFRQGQEGGPRGPHPDFNYNRANSPGDAPAWEEDPEAQEAEYADILDGQSAPRDRSREQYEEFRSSLGADDETIYGGGIGGRVRKGLDRFGATPFGRRMKEGMANYNAPYALGGGLLEIGTGAARLYEEENKGQYLTPEQRETAAAGLLPGAGATVGAVIGIAGGNPMLGAMAGGAVGQVAQGVITAGDERAQAGRELSERLNASLGGTAEALEKLRAAADATGAPLQQLGQGLATLQGFGPGAGAEAIAGAGRSALAQGEYFQHDTEATGRFLAGNPALAPLTSQFIRQGSELTRGQFEGIAGLALSEGNTDAFNTAMMQAQRAARNSDTEYQKDAKAFAALPSDLKTAGADGNPLYNFDIWFHDHAPAILGGDVDDDVTRARDARVKLGARGRTLDGDVKTETDAYTREFLDVSRGRQGLIDAGLGEKIAETGFSIAAATGSSAAGLCGRLPGLRTAYGAASAADQTLIDTDTGLMNKLDPNDPNFVALRSAYQTDINRAKADQVDSPLHIAQSARAVLADEIEESGAAFGLRNAGARAGLTRGLLGGRTYAQLQGEEEDLTGGERGRAAEIRREATNPLLRPAERFKMQAEATGLETEAETQQYGFKIARYGQTLAGIDERQGEANLGVARAQVTGGPEDVYAARGAVVDTFTAKIKELTDELHRGGLTVDDRIGKERELTGARQASVQETFTRDQGRFNDNYTLTETEEGTAEVGLPRRMARLGNAGFDPRITSLARDAETEAQSHLDFDRKNYGGNKQLIADDERRAAQAREGYQEALDRQNPYQRTGALTRRLTSDETGFTIAQEAPFMEGPDSNVLTRGTALLRDYRADLSALNANRQKHLTAGDWRDEDETGYTRELNEDKLKIARFEHDRLYLGVLPQEVEKRIGSPGGGIGVAITPLAAAAQGSGPYNPAFGGFGSHPNPLMTAVGGLEHEGGAMGMWWATRGGNSPGGSQAGGAGPSTPAAPHPASAQGVIGQGGKADDLLAQAVALLRQIAQNGRGFGQSPPMSPQAAVQNYHQDNARF